MSDHKNLTKATLRGTFWEYIAQYSGKFLVFISTAVLARLLFKEDFGIAGYALVVIGFLEVIEGLGIGPAIIYHHADPDRMDTAFWLSLGIGFSLFCLSWFLAAPLAGAFFQDARAVPVTRVLGLEFIISAFSLVHAALLTKRLAFGRNFVPQMSRSLSKGVASIALAFYGFGAWSLIIGQLVGVLVASIIYWVIVPWRPSFRFHRNLAGSLLSYGARVVSSDGLGILMLNMDYLLVGRFMGAAALGVYTLAFRVPELLVKQFCNIVGKVTFPVYSQIRDDPQALRRGFLVTIRYVTMITIPLGLGLALVAEPFVLTFFTEKWVDAVPVMVAISLYTLLRSLVFNAGGVYKATGRPGLLSKLNLIQAMITIPALWWAAVHINTLVAVAWMQVLLALLAGAVKLIMAGRLINIPLRDLFRTFYPSLAAGGVMAMAVLAVAGLLAGTMPWIQLIVETAVGALVYSSLLFLLQREDVLRAGTMLRGFLPKASRA